MGRVCFWCLVLFSGFLLASDHGTLRVNFYSGKPLVWEKTEGMRLGTGSWKNKQGKLTYEHLFTKDVTSLEWTPVEIRVTPEESGAGRLELMVYEHPRKPWLRVKDVSVQGASLANCALQSKDGRLAGWDCSAANLAGVAPGEVRVSYACRIGQGLAYTAGTPVVLRMQVRLEKLQVYEPPVPKAAGANPAIYIIGDSTACRYGERSKPLTGWGECLEGMPGVEVRNHAVSGENTRGFKNRKLWYDVTCLLRQNDFVLIQLGHNDQKKTGTSLAEYKENLVEMIAETRRLGAVPVLVTPVCRREFVQGVPINSLLDRSFAMKDLAQELKVDLIDLNSLSFDFLERVGEEDSKRYYNHLKPGESPNFPEGRRDNTHFNGKGAALVASLIVSDAYRQNLLLAHYLVRKKMPALPEKKAELPPPTKVKVRIDVVTPTAGAFDLCGGMTKETQTTRDSKGNFQSYTSIFRVLEQEKWVNLDFSFFPKKSENLQLRLLTMPTPKDQEVWLLIDKVAIAGATLKNSDFRNIAVNGDGFEGWHASGYAMNFAWKPGMPIDRHYCAKVNYRNVLSQTIAVQENRQVSMSLRVRPLKLRKLSNAPDENWAVDPESGVPVLISKGAFQLVPTFENCGVYLLRTPEQRGRELECKVFYRKAGEARWKTSLPPVEMVREHAWRLSILGLREGTDYECKAELWEKGTRIDIMEKRFRTQDSRVPIARTIEIDAEAFGGSMTEFQSGTAEGYVCYTAKKDAVLKGSCFDAVLKATKAHHVIFEGLTVDANCARSALVLESCEYIQVRNCNFYNFGRSDWVRDYHRGGVWTHKGNVTGWDGGIRLENSGNILVERCLIHDPHSSANCWFYSHPTGPEAIFVQSSKGNLVIRYNDFIASDKRRWNDAVECSGNFEVDGGLLKDSDVYGNHFACTNDDGIELEGGAMNQRCYLNYFDRCFTGVSTGNTMLGPSYVFRNLYGILGDECGRVCAPFKNGGSGPSFGTVYLLNNSVGFPNSSAFGGIGSVPDKTIPVKMVVENNLVRVNSNLYAWDFPKWNLQVDHNVIEMPDAGRSAVQKQFAKEAYDKNGLWQAIPYLDADHGDFRLANVPKVAVGTLGLERPGAFQDDGIISLPYRPLAVEVFPKLIQLKEPLKEATAAFGATAGKNFSGHFTLFCNDDFFTVTPMEGQLEEGRTQNFTVSLDLAKMPWPRRYNGVILIRFDDGFSRAVSLQADLRRDASRIAAAEKHALVLPMNAMPGNSTFEGRVDIPEDGCYFVFVKGKNNGKTVCDMKIGPVHTTPDRARLLPCGPETDGKCYACLFNGGGGLSGWYFHLPKGKHAITFKPGLTAKDALDTLYLTREPELFLNR